MMKNRSIYKVIGTFYGLNLVLRSYKTKTSVKKYLYKHNMASKEIAREYLKDFKLSVISMREREK